MNSFSSRRRSLELPDNEEREEGERAEADRGDEQTWDGLHPEGDDKTHMMMLMMTITMTNMTSLTSMRNSWPELYATLPPSRRSPSPASNTGGARG